MTPEAVITHFGSAAAAARELKLSPPSIAQWLESGEIPIDRQCQIEILTSGTLLADRDEHGKPVKRDPRSRAPAPSQEAA